jgi:EGF-like domain
LERRRNL